MRVTAIEWNGGGGICARGGGSCIGYVVGQLRTCEDAEVRRRMGWDGMFHPPPGYGFWVSDSGDAMGWNAAGRTSEVEESIILGMW